MQPAARRVTGVRGRLIAVVVAMIGAACASPGAPPGGPPDEQAPVLLKVKPDSFATNVKPNVVMFQFDEVINERSSGGGFGGGGGGNFSGGSIGSYAGASGNTSGGGGGGGGASALSALFLISPMSGDNDVSWHRTRVEVRPRKGWRRNTTYVVRLLPGISDLRNNHDSVGRTIVFSTGPEIASGLVSGIVFDWITGKIAPGAWIEARPKADTTLAYVTFADTLGRFKITNMPPGAFLLRAIIDLNKNHAIDPREAYDSATVQLTDSLTREMLAFPHDTIGPGIATVDPKDSVTLRITFDRALDPRQPITANLFTLKAADSSRVDIASVLTTAAFDSIRTDSLRRAATADSLKRVAAADSARLADSVKAVAAGQRPKPQVPVRRPPPPVPVRADTTKKLPPPKPSRPPPVSDAVLRLATPLKPGASYRLVTDSVRNLLGHPRSSSRVFTTAKPGADSSKSKTKGDSTKVRRDSTRLRPGTAPPRTPADSVRRDSTRARADTVRRPGVP